MQPDRPSAILPAPTKSQSVGRKPWRPLTRFIFRQVLERDEESAVRLMLPFWYLVLRLWRRARKGNFRFLCGPSSDPARIKSLEKRHLRYYSRLNVHIMRLSSQGLQELPAVIQATGEENVAAALRGGRGLLLTVAHT